MTPPVAQTNSRFVPSVPPVPQPDEPVAPSTPGVSSLPSANLAMSSIPLSGVSDSGTATREDATNGDKSPLEILEEILAEANTEKSKEDDVKKKKEQEDLEFAQQLAAKEAAFQQEAAAEIEKKRQDVEEAKVRRDDVEADLKAQGKGSDTIPDVTEDTMAIHQLEHDKVH